MSTLSDPSGGSGEEVVPVIPYVGTGGVTGKHRFPRGRLERRFDSVMATTSGGKAFGLRRTGKSSEIKACRERLATQYPDWVVLELNAEGYDSEARLLRDILESLPSKGWMGKVAALVSADNAIAQGARDAIKKFMGGESDTEAYVGPIMQAIEKGIDVSQVGLVLVIDEFPWMCRSILESDKENGRRRVDVLLASLRRWRGKGVKMLLSGSIGMAALCRQYDLDKTHLNDLRPIDVPPLEPGEARRLVSGLVLGSGVQGWTEEHTDLLLDECAALYPSVIQLAFLELSEGGQAAEIEDIEGIFVERVRPDLDGNYYSQFNSRQALYASLESLSDVLPRLLEAVLQKPEIPLAYSDLVRAAGEDVIRADIDYALDILREDGFLLQFIPKVGPHTWKAASPLVTAWWRQCHGGRISC